VKIKEKEEGILEVQKEIKDMKYKYSNTEDIFRAEKDRADKYTKLY
jgi:hypothetical protein